MITFTLEKCIVRYANYFSTIMDKKVEMAFGLYFDKFFLILFLYVGVTTADLSYLGNIPCEKQKFIFEVFTCEKTS